MNLSRLIISLFLISVLIWAFGIEVGPIHAADPRSGYSDNAPKAVSGVKPVGDRRDGGGWTVRAITMREIERLGDRDWELSPSFAKRVLARLNARDFDYIDEDIRNGKPIKVPNDFTVFKNWTPLPRFIPEISHIPKFVLIAKDVPFIGWYERGRLVGDTYVCIGKQEDWTRPGIYTVREKDRNHVSRSYPNAYGQPAPMPWALRIYGLVWIHAGDIVGGRCSHGCINLPMFPAMKLFEWASPGTPVVIVNVLSEAPAVIARNRTECPLLASACSQSKAIRDES